MSSPRKAWLSWFLVVLRAWGNTTRTNKDVRTHSQGKYNRNIVD